jgi:hypothetical protein
MINDINLLLAQNESFRFVKVEFPSGNQLYTYKTLLDVSEGDFVIVDTPSTGFKVVKVIKVLQLHELPIDEHSQKKWVVQQIDDSTYIELCNREQEAQLVLNRSKTKKLIKDLGDEIKSQIGDKSFKEVQKLTRL